MKDLSFEEICNDILNNKKYVRIVKEKHHGITRLEHSKRVAKYVYIISKKVKIDYISATRAAILHDFFVSEDLGNMNSISRCIVHPYVASLNANQVFGLNEKEKNAIESHMFPLNTILPKYKESWLLTIVDKFVAMYEFSLNKFNFFRYFGIIHNKLQFIFVFCIYFITQK